MEPVNRETIRNAKRFVRDFTASGGKSCHKHIEKDIEQNFFIITRIRSGRVWQSTTCGGPV